MVLMLIISDYGGFNNFLTELSSSIAGNTNNSLHVVCSNLKVIDIPDKNVVNKENIHFHFINIPRTITIIGQIKAAKKIRSIIKKVKPDLVHSHFTTSTFPTILFRKKAFSYWSTIHGVGMNSTYGLRKMIFTIVETIIFMRLDKIFVLNTQDYTLLRKKFLNKVTKYRCFGMGCDIDKFNVNKYSLEKRNELKTELNIGSNQVVIAFTGRYVKFKGFDIVIKIFERLNQKHPNKYKLILMGGFDPIHQTGLDNNEIQFFNNNPNILNIGFTIDVDKYLSITDIFLFPSKKEGLPTCILEALAMGVNVVTFDSRGNNDIIKHQYNGILIKPSRSLEKDVTNMIVGIEALTENTNTGILLTANALRDRDQYSRQRFIDEHLKYYSDFMELQTNHKIN